MSASHLSSGRLAHAQVARDTAVSGRRKCALSRKGAGDYEGQRDADTLHRGTPCSVSHFCLQTLISAHDGLVVRLAMSVDPPRNVPQRASSHLRQVCYALSVSAGGVLLVNQPVFCIRSVGVGVRRR